MNTLLTDDTKAIILLCGILGKDRSVKILSLREYSSVVKWLVERQLRPEVLLDRKYIPVLAEETNTSSAQELIQRLQQQLEQLRAQIEVLMAELESLRQVKLEIKEEEKEIKVTLKLIRQLREGVTGEDVELLQEILATDSDVYPEGLVTGNFLSLTMTAVIRFQEKYSSEILNPLNLEQGTGYFGKLSRQKANIFIHN